MQRSATSIPGSGRQDSQALLFGCDSVHPAVLSAEMARSLKSRMPGSRRKEGHPRHRSAQRGVWYVLILLEGCRASAAPFSTILPPSSESPMPPPLPPPPLRSARVPGRILSHRATAADADNALPRPGLRGVGENWGVIPRQRLQRQLPVIGKKWGVIPRQRLQRQLPVIGGGRGRGKGF